MLGLKSMIVGAFLLFGYVAHYGADIPSFMELRSQVLLAISAVLISVGVIGGMLGLKLVILGTALLIGYVAHYGADLSFFWLTRSQFFLAVSAAMIIYGMVRPD